MSHTAHNRKDQLHAEICKQFGSKASMRFIKSLPSFEVKQGLPDQLANLLNDLDHAESRQRRGGGAD